MKVTVVVVGRVRGPLASAVADYEARARRYWKLEVIEVDAGARAAKARGEDVRSAEEERIVARLPSGSEVLALTRTGEPTTSAALARRLGDLALRGSPGATFVVGGAFGLGEGVLERAAQRISLSSLTFPHELARLVLAEQLYRAGTILRSEPYHKGA